MPSLRDLLLDWQRGVQAVARGDWGCALRLFSGVPGPPAKMCFNMGCVHLLAGDPEAALRAFDQAVAKDVYLAVGFFQRGVANFQLERSQEALSDFQVALAQLRGNSAIDYTQLGLHFKLQAWEVLFNVAATQCRLGLWAEAARSLEDAVSKGPEGARRDLGGALAQVQEQGTLQPRSVPRGEVFRPLRQHLEHLKPMDFLGKAKVVVASGTGPQQPQVPDQGWGARPRAGPRAHDTGPRGVSTPLGPRTPPSAAMEVGSGQAAGRADHHVPDTEAEQRPHREQAGQQAPVGRPAAGRPDRESSEDPVGAGPQGVAVTVQCAFTLALEAPRGASLSSLRALLCKALPAQARCGQLRWWPSTATLPSGLRTWTCSRATLWTSCVKWTGRGWRATVMAELASSPSASWSRPATCVRSAGGRVDTSPDNRRGRREGFNKSFPSRPGCVLGVVTSRPD
ncbi:NADPH oxidase activator 1 isoform X11 [Artibeus jamaicensis]|uniref:NADPH oxidase activator 1 isoform X11 n=1 Tax=Artibeus jamaicensis TaxID=9417 RepID=UPI00235A6F20|nr:NADPH oxidase activator 1 isoform X11 [Artibeus jamaicensis]